MAQQMTQQELFQTARTNYQHLVKICERLELNGYWERPKKVLKQPIIMTLNIYVQSVLLLYAVYANCLTPQIRLWLQKITGEDTIRIVDFDTNENILKLARKITYSPPILLQLCGVTDRENGTDDACVFLDSILNMILVFACQAESEVRDFTRFIQEYYQHVQVFLNQDTANDKMNARYLFRKLSCERIEESLCLYIEDKRKEERQRKIKEDLERLDLSEHERRKNYLSNGDEEEEKEQEADPFDAKAFPDGVVWVQEDEEENGKTPEKENIVEILGEDEEPENRRAEEQITRDREKETADRKRDDEIGLEAGKQHTETPDFAQKTDMERSVILEISEHADLFEVVLKQPVIFEKCIMEAEVLNVHGLSLNPRAQEWAKIGRLVWKEGRKPEERRTRQEAENTEKQELKQEAGVRESNPASESNRNDKYTGTENDSYDGSRGKNNTNDTKDINITKDSINANYNYDKNKDISESGVEIELKDSGNRHQDTPKTAKTSEPIPDAESIKKGFDSLKLKMEAARTRELDNLLDELNGLIGLEAVKEEINSLINLIKVRKMREKYGMPMMDMTYHMVFTGSPGTGKTTVARLVAKIYKELGILSRGEVIETDRSGLVAGYIGQTAIKVKEVVESALGGVLFIDEAYSLTNGNRTEDFGGEVIDTLVKLMEDHRDDLVVIVAGYTDEMKDFLKSNSGLVSRFNKFIEFKDYTDTELLDILDSMAQKAGFSVAEGAREQLGGQLGSMTEQKKKEFGNARGIRNVFEKIVVNQANRLVGAKEPTKEELGQLLEEDVYHVIL